MKKKLAVLGSTEAVGIQALNIVSQYPDSFEVEVLATFDNAELILQQAKAFQPNAIVIHNETAFEKVKTALSKESIKVFCGQDSLCELVTWKSVQLVLVASTGFHSLRPVLSAIEAGKAIAMANREVLAAAGQLIRKKLLEKNNIFIPVNKGLASIFQCLLGEDNKAIHKIILAASGGPFFGKKTNYLVNVKKDHALQSPSMIMDEKSAIDAATLMNKGLEMLAAKYLFGLDNDQFEIVIQPQAAVQSLIQFKDGTIKTMMSEADSAAGLIYSLNFPKRIKTNLTDFTINNFHKLTFEQPDTKTFKSILIAKDVLDKGGNMPCALNAANEVVVQAFLNNKVGFLEMTEMIEEALPQITFIENPTVEELEKTDEEMRKLTLSLTKKSQLFN